MYLYFLKMYILYFITYVNAWNYDNGGKDWKHLCNLGKNQSPININDKHNIIINNNNHPKFYFKNNLVEYFNNGIYLEYSPLVKDNLGYFSYQDNKYFIQQFHYHSVSEHSINNKIYPLELHIVGKDDKNQLSVISILFKIGKDNTFLNKIGWDKKIKDLSMPLCRDNKILRPCIVDDPINNYVIQKKEETQINILYLNKLLKNNKFYHYLGSLTTPPCTENINWLILSKPIEITSKQLSYYTSLLKKDQLLKKNHFHNNRDIQDINNRIIDIV